MEGIRYSNKQQTKISLHRWRSTDMSDDRKSTIDDKSRRDGDERGPEPVPFASSPNGDARRHIPRLALTELPRRRAS